MNKGGIVAKAAFQRRMDEIKDDITAGRIKFYNPPPEWTEGLLKLTALNSVLLLLLAHEAKWN